MTELTLFRIYIEDKSHDYEFDALVKSYFGYATMYPARGLWDGEEEKSYIIEYISTVPSVTEKNCQEFADAFCKKYNQKCAFITQTKIQGRYSHED